MSIYLGRENEALIGTMGDDPRKTASVEIGRVACDLIVDGMIRKAKELIKFVDYIAKSTAERKRR